MPTATIAALEDAAATQSLDTWLAALPDDVLRSQVRRALTLDRRLWSEHPASIASCLLARTFDLPGLDALRTAWTHELDSRGTPWIRPLRALSVADGLLAELHGDSRLSLEGLQRPRFVSDSVALLEAIHFHPSVQAPELRRKDRLRWDWETGAATLEPDPREEQPPPGERYPRIETDGWGPAYLVRAAGRARELLPCPPEGSAHADFSADGRRLFVYGSHDEYAGGFVYVVDVATLAIERHVDTAAPVATVHECSRPDLLLLRTYRGLVVWQGEQLHALPMKAEAASLSPSGRYVATFDGQLRIWLLAEFLGRGEAPRAGFPTCFDPSGTRLLSGRRLTDGRTGALLAELTPDYGQYLEGGPAAQWLHFGERFLIMMHAGLSAWDARTGAPLRVQNSLHFSHWYSLAYDRAGTRLAALSNDTKKVELYELPEGRRLTTIGFDLPGKALAMSADGATLAVRRGPQVEVRAASGALLGRFAHPSAHGTKEEEERRRDDAPRFSEDGSRIASFHEGDGWRIWALTGEHTEHLVTRAELEAASGFTVPRPRDWDLEAGSRTVFVHRPTGTRIALPAGGPWVCNPADPRNLACDALHIELRAR